MNERDGATSGRAETSRPKILPLALNHRNFDLHGQPEKGTAKFYSSSSSRSSSYYCSDKGAVFAGGGGVKENAL